MKYRGLPALSLALTLAAAAALPAAAQYTFTNRIDNSTLQEATSFDAAQINNSGALVYAINSSAALYSNSGGNNTRIAGVGETTPLGSAYTILDSTTYTLDNSGRVTFRSNIVQSGGITSANNQALWRWDSGSITTLVQKGVTTMPGGGTFTSLGNYSTNDSGDFLIVNTTSGSRRIVKGSGGTLTNFVTQGQTAPGTSSQFDGFAFPSLANDGSAIFFGSSLAVNAGIFSVSAGGTISDLVLQGDTATGVPNTNFSTFPTRFGYSPVSPTNPLGTVVFNSLLINTANGNTSRTLWTLNGSTLSALAQPGGAAPGGAFFGNTNFSIGNTNASGTSVFRASGMTGAYTEAVFALSGVDMTRVLSQGDSLFGSIVTRVGTPWINDNGQIALSYELQSGQKGILLAAIGGAATAPEPNAFILSFLGIGALGVSRRLRKRS